jgi:hypothetical protein
MDDYDYYVAMSPARVKMLRDMLDNLKERYDGFLRKSIQESIDML